jgi:hypothetical protein
MPMPDLCQHGRKVCSDCVIVTDAARRAYDVIQAYVAFVDWETRIRSWVALRLADGSSDGNLYESRLEAVRHQPDEQLCAYYGYRNSPNGFASRKDAQLYMDYHRMAYDQGFRLPDPDDKHGGPELIMPTAQEQLMLQRQAWAGMN